MRSVDHMWQAALAQSKQLRQWQPMKPFTPYGPSPLILHVGRSQGPENLALPFGSSQPICFCTYFLFPPPCVFMYVQICMHVSVYVDVCTLRITLGIILRYTFHLFWDKVSHWSGGLPIRLCFLAMGPLGWSWSCLFPLNPLAFSTWIISVCHHAYHFLHWFWALGIKYLC